MYTIRMDLWLLAGLFILILVGIPLVFAFSMGLAALKAAQEAEQKQAAQHAALARAVMAAATVVSAPTSPGRPGSGYEIVRVTLSVEPPQGETYSAVVNWEVEPLAMHLLQPGAVLAVKINPDDPRQVFPNFSGARLSV